MSRLCPGRNFLKLVLVAMRPDRDGYEHRDDENHHDHRLHDAEVETVAGNEQRRDGSGGKHQHAQDQGHVDSQARNQIIQAYR